MTSYRTILAAGVAAVALTAAGQALAQSKTLYVGMNGGNFEKTFTQAVFPDFEKANDVKVVVVPGTSSDILAKATAAKDKPQMHVMFLDDGVMVRAVSAGLGFANFNRLINHHRIEQAKQVLASDDDRSILEIALDCGFGSVGPFNRAFKAETRMTPKAWRASARQAA